MAFFNSLVQQVYNFTGSLDPRLMAALFLLCAIGEFGLPFPYLLETLWLLAGFQIGTKTISVLDVAVLLLTVQAGRQTGATTLYFLTRLGKTPLGKLYDRLGITKLSQKLPENKKSPFRLLHKIDFFSPFSIAFGRLMWLRVPLTLALGMKRRIAALSGGVLLSGLIWDMVYIVVGMIAGTTATLKPAQMLLYSLAGLTTLYLIGFSVKLIRGRRPAQPRA